LTQRDAESPGAARGVGRSGEWVGRASSHSGCTHWPAIDPTDSHPARPAFAEKATRHPALIPQEVAGSSRRNPAIRASRRTKDPAHEGNPRPIPAQAGTAMTGLSRRRSRVRVPSLPSLEVPANTYFCCHSRRGLSPRGPKPVAQTSSAKRLQNDHFLGQVCVRPHKPSGVTIG
jgi:hypothetical protein